MTTTHNGHHHSPSKEDSLTLTLDQRGHLEEPPCTWAPPASNFSERAGCRTFCGTVINTTTISLTHDTNTKQKSPEQEHFPPMYSLPGRSTHYYEVDSAQMGPKERRDSVVSTMSVGSHQETEMMGFNMERRQSFNMEDFKRSNHMKMIYQEK